MASSGDDAPTDGSDEETASRPASDGGAVAWLLVEGNRLHIAVGAALLVFLALVGLAELDAIAFTNPNSLTRMASGMIAGTFSLVTVVVSINQLILSQEFSPAGQFRDRREGVEAFYRDVEDAAGVAAAPTAPSGLLELLATVIRRRADDLADVAGEHPDDAVRERVVDLAGAVKGGTRRLEASLEEADATAFEALSAALEYDDAQLLYELRGRRNEAAVRSTALEGAFDDLADALRLFDTAQEHLKTTYLQRELTRFSQLTIYFGVPALLAAVLIALVYGDLGGATVSHAGLPYVVSFLVTLVVLPLVLLASFILRTATITRRTAAIGPMLSGSDAAARSSGEPNEGAGGGSE